MSEYTLPSDRIAYDWSPNTDAGVGVWGGGIPARTDPAKIKNMVTDFGADPTGAVSCDGAFASALASISGSEWVIYFPPGTYKTSGLNIPFDASTYRSALTIRGAGPTQTIFDCHGGSGATFGYGASYFTGSTPNANVTAGLTKGSSTLTVNDGTGFYAGGAAMIRFPNNPDPNEIAVSVKALDYVRTHTVLVTGRSGNTLSIFPPLPCDFPITSGVQISEAQQSGAQIMQYFVGIEDCAFDGTNLTGNKDGISIGACSGCWLKNVKITNHSRYGILAEFAIRLEIRHCEVGAGFGGGGPGQSGVILNSCCNFLFEDNYLHHNQPGLQINEGCTGSVIAYNYFKNGINQLNLTLSHQPQNAYNLIEGNVGVQVKTDNYWGGVQHHAIFRNWFTGVNDQVSVQTGIVVALLRFTRKFSLVGNVFQAPGFTWPFVPYSFGNPNIGNGASNGEATPSAGDWWIDWDVANSIPKAWPMQLTTRTDNLHGIVTVDPSYTSDFLAHVRASAGYDSGTDTGQAGTPFTSQFANFTFISGNTFAITTAGTGDQPLPALNTSFNANPSAYGWQEIDHDTETTCILKGNYNFKLGAIPAGETLSGQTLANSWFRTGTPSFFGSLAFPPVDATTPPDGFTTADIAIIPAAWRAEYGNEDYLGGVSAPSFAPGAGSFGSAQSVSISCATSGATIYYTTDGSTPNTGSSVYSSALTISTTTTLKAFAVKSGLVDSGVTTGVYTIGGGGGGGGGGPTVSISGRLTVASIKCT